MQEEPVEVQEFKKRFINLLPLPIYLAGLFLVIFAMVFKEFRGYSSYLQVIKDPIFPYTASFVILGLLIFYLVVYHIPKFQKCELGILICGIENDSKSHIQSSILDILQPIILGSPGLKNVQLKSTKKVIYSHKDAMLVARKSRALICVWFVSFEKNLYYHICTPYSDFNVNEKISYPDIPRIADHFQTFLDRIIPPQGFTAAQFRYLEKNLDDQRNIFLDRIAKLELQVAKTNKNLEIELERRRRRLVLIIVHSSGNADKIKDLITAKWGNCRINLLQSADATKERILSGLQELAIGAQAEDQVWLYYAGPTYVANGTAYVLTYGYQLDGNSVMSEDELRRNGISLDQICIWFESLIAKQAIMFADAKLSGDIVNRINHEEKSRVVITAGEMENDGVQNQPGGLFTNYLLDGLSGLASGEDGFVRIRGLFEFIREKINEKISITNNLHQTNPKLYSISLEDMVLSIKDKL